MNKAKKVQKLHVKSGDTVCIMSGKYEDKFDKDGKRKTGKVLQVSPKEGKIIVEGLHVVTKHVKPRKMGTPGGIVKAEGAIYASKVQIYCQGCKAPVRTGQKLGEDGSKTRVCKKCGKEI